MSRFIHIFLMLTCLFPALVLAEQSLEQLMLHAEKGDVKAQFKLGIMYFKGQETSQDYQKALEWLQKAADQGLPEAQYNIGVMYSKGTGVTQDFAEALKWFGKAAEQNNSKAQYNLGLIYASGVGVPRDKIKAYAWMILAHWNGYERASDILLEFNEEMTASEMEKAEALAVQMRKNLTNPP